MCGLRLSLKLGGHILFDEEGRVLKERLRSYGEVLRKLYWMDHEVHVVVGGGPPARRFIEAARSMGCSEAMCDEIGIQVSRVNALLLLSVIEDFAYPAIPSSYAEARLALSSGKMVVCGGFQPGQSTVAVAAVLAELMKADLLVVATDVDGVYTGDPKISPKARKLERLSYRELLDLMSRGSAEAGTFKLFDHVAIKVMERAKIATVVIDGRDPANLLKLVVEGEAIGTRIGP